MPRVYISIGSNIDRECNIRGAVQALAQTFGDLTLSSVYESEAVGFTGDPFYNLVAGFDTDLPVETVQETLKRIEEQHGRSRENVPRFSSRTLDLDILLYGELVRHDAQFDIPRDEITRHAFVLRPLIDVAPALTHPESGLTVVQMLDELARDTAPPRRTTFEPTGP